MIFEKRTLKKFHFGALTKLHFKFFSKKNGIFKIFSP